MHKVALTRILHICTKSSAKLFRIEAKLQCNQCNEIDLKSGNQFEISEITRYQDDFIENN